MLAVISVPFARVSEIGYSVTSDGNSYCWRSAVFICVSVWMFGWFRYRMKRRSCWLSPSYSHYHWLFTVLSSPCKCSVLPTSKLVTLCAYSVSVYSSRESPWRVTSGRNSNGGSTGHRHSKHAALDTSHTYSLPSHPNKLMYFYWRFTKNTPMPLTLISGSKSYWRPCTHFVRKCHQMENGIRSLENDRITQSFAQSTILLLK